MASSLAQFNMLPSFGVHLSRRLRWPVPEGDLPAAVHRQVSQALLEEHRLEPVLSFDEPALPLALLPPELYEQLALYCGLAMNARNIRRAITRDEVSVLQQQLGEQALAFARARHGGGLAGLPPPSDWDPAHARASCEAWGHGLLALAFGHASEALARRAALRGPESAGSFRLQLERAGLSAESALALAREFLDVLEPSWLSSFHATR
jgi:hypothetical protein